MSRLAFVGTFGLVALAVLMSGCAGEESGDPADARSSQSPASASPSPEAEHPVGALRWDYAITDSTIPANKPGPKSRTKRVVFLSCADDDCASLYQRADSVGWAGSTVQLTPTPDGYAGAQTRTGDCPEADGGFSETFTWSWTVSDDDVLQGEVQQEFEGCDLDGSTTYVGTARLDPELTLPYLAEPDAAALAAALTDYDATVATVYDAFDRCVSLPEGTPRATRCFESLYRDWEPGIGQLAASSKELLRTSESACRATADELDLEGLVDAARAAARTYTTREGNAAVKIAGEEHELLTLAALMCVPPQQYATLGDGGKLAIDLYQAVPPS